MMTGSARAPVQSSITAAAGTGLPQSTAPQSQPGRIRPPIALGVIAALFLGSFYVLLPTILQADPTAALEEQAGGVDRKDTKTTKERREFRLDADSLDRYRVRAADGTLAGRTGGPGGRSNLD